MKSIFLISAFLLLSQFAFTQDSPKVTPVTIQPNQATSVVGDLSHGAQMDDLSWAWNSSVACFPETQKNKFTGNHVLYSTVIPARSEMEITVIPEDKKANFSIYAYQIGEGRMDVVPNLSSCIRCEVDHKWDRPWKGKKQNHTRTAKNLVGINNPYQVIIGVVGAEGLDAGAYTLEFNLKTK